MKATLLPRALLLLLLSASSCSAFLPTSSSSSSSIASRVATPVSLLQQPQSASRVLRPQQQQQQHQSTQLYTFTIDRSEPKDKVFSRSLVVAGYLSNIVAWTTLSYIALSSHPTAAIEAMSTQRHNLLTVAQALVFPLPLLTGVYGAFWATTTAKRSSRSIYPHQIHMLQRLSLGLAAASLWTAAAVVKGPDFSCGYRLFEKCSPLVTVGTPALYTLTALGAVGTWFRSGRALEKRGIEATVVTSGQKQKNPLSSMVHGIFTNTDTVLYSLGTAGLLALAALPQLTSFPTATIPSILGKRFSRSASGYQFLGAIVSYCLVKHARRTNSNPALEAADQFQGIGVGRAHDRLKRGLGVGALLHLALVLAKLVGVDGGGYFMKGKGLWNLYPSLVAADPAAVALMMVTYGVLVIATFKPKRK